MMSFAAPKALHILNAAMTSSYSALSLEVVNLNCNAYSSFTPLNQLYFYVNFKIHPHKHLSTP